MLKNYKLIIAYDGSNYGGWQVQPNSTSIQELMQKAIETIVRDTITLIGSGRTDAGVHAIGQVAHFKIEKELDLKKFSHSLNGILPIDIRVLHVEQVPLDFHSQRSAKSKIYHYHIHNHPVQNPFKRHYSLHIRDKIDISLLQQAASLFVGKHDFTSFANESHQGCAAKNPVRNILRLDVVQDGDDIRLEFEADGFLYKMVRNIVGTLLEVIKGRRSLDDIPRLLAARDRTQAGQAAPAHALFLHKVKY